MFTNKALLVSAVLLAWACGGKAEHRAQAAAIRQPSPPPAAAPVRTTTTASKTPKKTASKPAAKPATTTAAKPATSTTTKTSTKSMGSSMVLDVPEAHYPPAGQCRVWKKEATIFQQPQAQSCDGILRSAPAGSRVLERPASDSKVIRVRYIDTAKAGHVVRTKVFDAKSGKYLKDV